MNKVKIIGANVIEAKANSPFLNYALKPANESRFSLGLLRDSDRGNRATVNELLKETTENANIIVTSMLTLKGRKGSIFTF